MKRGFFVKSISSHSFLVLFSLLCVVALEAVSFGANKSSQVLNVYTSRHYDVDQDINELFFKQTGIRVQQVQIKEAAQLIERVKAEGSSSPADVIITVDVGNLWRAENAGILAKSNISQATERLSSNLRHPEGLWYALSQRARVIVYRKDKVKPEEVSSYEALVNPKWKGRVLVRTSNHVYNQSLVASMIFHEGKDKTKSWIDGVASNLARKPEGGDTDQIKAVALGVGDLALVNSYYVVRLMNSDKKEDQEVVSKIGVSFPTLGKNGTHINISGAGIAKNAPNRAAAEQYLSFLLSDEIQQKYTEVNGEYAASLSVAPSINLKKLPSKLFDAASLASIGSLTPEAIKLLDASKWR
jgi:iron(III) transport system substrate-binding protein